MSFRCDIPQVAPDRSHRVTIHNLRDSGLNLTQRRKNLLRRLMYGFWLTHQLAFLVNTSALQFLSSDWLELSSASLSGLSPLGFEAARTLLFLSYMMATMTTYFLVNVDSFGAGQELMTALSLNIVLVQAVVMASFPSENAKVEGLTLTYDVRMR